MSTTADVHVADLPALLAERGEVGYRLVVNAPKGAVDDDLRRLLARHKPALVEALARADAYGDPSVTYADVLTRDDQGFDWASGERRRVPGGDDDLTEFKATLDALTTEGREVHRGRRRRLRPSVQATRRTRRREEAAMAEDLTTATPYGFRVLGDRRARRRPIDWMKAFEAHAACDPKAEPDSESYLSHFTFGRDFLDHLGRNRSEAGYDGRCGVLRLAWDIDRADDLEAARRDARRLLGFALDSMPELDDDDPLVYFSGSKGFHVDIPATWRPEPSTDLHLVARRFCLDLAESAGVVVDPLVYSKTRLFRSPNSRHPKTELHKRRLTLDEITHLKLDAILDLARTPEPFGVRPGPDPFPSALKLWRAAETAVRAEKAERRGAGGGRAGDRLTAGLRRFIRDGEVDPERRAVAVFRAAAELAEYRQAHGFDDLVRQLLWESALDSGLSPAEVEKQIRDGLARGKRDTREGDAE